MSTSEPPRMTHWLLISVVLFFLSSYLQIHTPGSLFAVSVYKAHLLSAGGWCGYWLDRAIFPYDRPHEYLHDTDDQDVHGSPAQASGADGCSVKLLTYRSYEWACMRRALIVAACLLGICLGA